MNPMKGNLIDELRRRGVLRVAAVYIVAAWLVMQIGDVFFPAWNIPDIAKRYLLLAAILGFPIALVFGWRYDITAKGIVVTPPAGEGYVPQSLGRGDYIALGTLALATVVIVYTVSGGIATVTREIESPGAADTIERLPNSVAVLPFANISDDPSNEFFCDGISEEILHRLADYRDMHVIARTSSFAFKGSDRDAASIARTLGVKYLLQGSVRKVGNKLRIAAALVDEQNLQVWSRTFDREMSDVFEIQRGIASAVAGSLASTILESHVEPSTYEPDINAYQQFLYGREYLRARTPGWQANANRYFDRATEIDPTYAAPHAGRAIATLLLGRDSRVQARWESAERSVAAALALNPDDANALAANGLLLVQQGRLADGEIVLRRALAIDPNVAGARVWLASTLAEQDRPEEAEAEYATALALDPLDPRLATRAAARYKEQGDFERAEGQYKRLLEQPRPSEFVYSDLFFLYDEYGRHVELIAAGKERILAHAILESEPQYYYAFLAYSYARIGMTEKAEYWQSRAESAPRVDLATHLRRIYIYRLQGRFSEGMEHLRKVLAETEQDIERSGSFIQRVVGASQIEVGDYASGAELIESTIDIGESVQGGYLTLDFLQYSAWARQQLGNTERAGELLAAIEKGILELQAEGLAQSPQMLFVFAQNHLLSGNVDVALDTLETAIDRGFRRYFWLLHDSRWESLHDDERFKALMARLKGYIAEQREVVERIDAEDDFIARLEAKLAAGSH